MYLPRYLYNLCLLLVLKVILSHNQLYHYLMQSTTHRTMIQKKRKHYNQYTKVQNPRYKDVTLNTYTSALTKLSLKSITV